MSLLSVNSSRLLILSLPLVLLLSACGDDVAGSHPETSNPGEGTTFTMEYYSSTSGSIDESSRDTMRQSVVEIHDTFDGKEDVIEVTGPQGSLYYATEENGDVYARIRLTFQAVQKYVWLKFPFGSDKVEEEVFDETTTNGPIAMHTTALWVAEVDGSEELTVGGETFTLPKVTGQIFARTVYDLGGGDEEEIDFFMPIDMVFLPVIGLPGKMSIGIGVGGITTDRTHSVMLDYDLK